MSAVEVRKATEDDIDSVVDLLFGHMSSKVPKARWRNLLDYPWRPADADRGCVAVADGRAVGFLGLVYADREIDGETNRFCNICAWYLLKDYRGQGIGQRIQMMSVADPSMTYTIMTATAATGRAFGTYSGFKVLDDARYVLRRGAGRGDLDVTEDPAALAEKLAPAERALFKDHRAYNMRHFLLSAGGGSCYVAMQVKRKGDDIDYHEVMHASDPAFLAAYAPAFADALLPPGKAVLAIDRRFVVGDAGWETETFRLPRWYRTPSVAPDRIDHLYGEIPLLDLKLP